MARSVAGQRFIAAPTLVETRISVFRKLGADGISALNVFISRFVMTVENFTEQHVALAEEAYLRFHASPARLNFGDCMAYALAKSRNDALLCKGNDFIHTDLRLVKY
jgi:ribonuclease VapC